MLNKPTRKEPVMSNQNAATVIYDDGTVTIAWRDFDTRSDAETWITVQDNTAIWRLAADGANCGANTRDGE
jgi:hypothetical protein